VPTSQKQLAQVESSYGRALADQRRAHAGFERKTGTTIERRHLKVE
jgi:hypothetical protein